MGESETIYTAILTAEYRDEQDSFDIDIQYVEALPARGPSTLVYGRYPIRTLAAGLDDDTENAFTDYQALYDLVVDEAVQEVMNETDNRATHWMTWLENEGYDRFVHVLSDTTAQAGETYLVVSSDKFSGKTILENAQSFLHDRRQEYNRRQATSSHLRSF